MRPHARCVRVAICARLLSENNTELSLRSPRRRCSLSSQLEGEGAAHRRGLGRCLARGELRDLGERQPIRLAFTPRVGVAIDLAGGESRAHFVDSQRPDLIFVDDEMPHAIVVDRRCDDDRLGRPATPRTTITLLHFLQRILKTLPRTLSSEMEYFASHASHAIFMRAVTLDSRAAWKNFQRHALRKSSSTHRVSSSWSRDATSDANRYVGAGYGSGVLRADRVGERGAICAVHRRCDLVLESRRRSMLTGFRPCRSDRASDLVELVVPEREVDITRELIASANRGSTDQRADDAPHQARRSRTDRHDDDACSPRVESTTSRLRSSTSRGSSSAMTSRINSKKCAA